MDNWLTYVALLVFGLAFGEWAGHHHEQRIVAPALEELSIHKEVDALMRKAGVDEWCELVLSGEITPVED